MGGIGSGGARVGAGRPRKAFADRLLTGTGSAADRRAVGAALPPVEVPMPEGLPAEVAAVWLALAPLALAERTLTAATAAAFVDLCRARVERDALARQVELDGRTFVKVSYSPAGAEQREIKAHPLIAQARAFMLRVQAGMVRFRLAPVGKEIVQAAPPADPFALFDGPAH